MDPRSNVSGFSTHITSAGIHFSRRVARVKQLGDILFPTSESLNPTIVRIPSLDESRSHQMPFEFGASLSIKSKELKF